MPTVYITAPPAAAADLARGLVEERLAVCVNRTDCRSVYRWDDDVVEEREVEDAHPHDVPCIERFDETDVLGAYGEWVAESVAPAD